MTGFKPATPCSRSRSVRFTHCAPTYQRGLHPGTSLRARAVEVLSNTYNWQYGYIGVTREATQKKPHNPGGESGFYNLSTLRLPLLLEYSPYFHILSIVPATEVFVQADLPC